MTDSVRTILSRLEPISDRVVRRPLSEEEIQVIQADVGLPTPSGLLEYFRIVGLFQDLTDYRASQYEVIDRADSFGEERQFLIKRFGPSAEKLFPFAGDGAGNIIAVAEGPDGGTLFFADHETREIKQIGSFCEWLSGTVDAALKGDRLPNAQKQWHVQFSFRAPWADPILAVLRQFGTVTLGQWSEPKVTPAKVRSFQAPIIVGENRLTLERSEYSTWLQPMFSLDYNEPVGLAASDSLIKKLDAAFRKAGLDYRLVDYGPLSLDSKEKPDAQEESAVQPAQAPWTKFLAWVKPRR